MSTKQDRQTRLITETKSIVEGILNIAKRPVVMFSGGKDSLVMTHIILEAFGKMDALFHREPFMSDKYAYGEGVLRAWGFPMFDYPPVAVSLWEGKDWFAYTNHYQTGGKGAEIITLDLPKNVIPPEPGQPWACLVDDVLDRPTAYFNYPWDFAFIGHKSCDEDQIAGKVPLKVDVAQNRKGPSGVFPIRNWTNDDIWDYIEDKALPVQTDRYNVLTREEHPGKRANGDYFHACSNCVDRRNPTSVYCPKLDMQVSNIGNQVPYRDLKLDYFGE